MSLDPTSLRVGDAITADGRIADVLDIDRAEGYFVIRWRGERFPTLMPWPVFLRVAHAYEKVAPPLIDPQQLYGVTPTGGILRNPATWPAGTVWVRFRPGCYEVAEEPGGS